jgi:hypothetical protein
VADSEEPDVVVGSWCGWFAGSSAVSNAILTLPPFAIQALRHHGRQQARRQQARWRLACGRPQTVSLRWVEPGLIGR